MYKTINKLMEQTEECLKEYAKKTEWTQQDVAFAKDAVSMYEKLHRILLDKSMLDECDEDEYSNRGDTVSHARGRDATTGRHISRRAPRYYDYDGHLTSYADGPEMHHNDQSMTNMRMRRRSYGPNEQRSMHSISDRMVQKLESLYDEADSDYERNQITEMIEAAKGNRR